MKNHILSAVTLLLVGITALPAIAQTNDEPEISISFDAAVLSSYVWRGLTLTDGMVLQPSATIGFGGLTLNAWMNMDLDDVNDNEFEFNEMDFVAEYGFSFDKVSITAGVIHYVFPNTDFDSTTEIYGSIGLDTALNPSVTFYQDMDLVEGSYISFSVSESVPVTGTNHSFDFGANLGYGTEDHNLFYYGVSKNTLTDLLLSGSFTYVVNDWLTLTPQAMFSLFMDDDIKENFEDESTFIFGVGASVSF